MLSFRFPIANILSVFVTVLWWFPLSAGESDNEWVPLKAKERTSQKQNSISEASKEYLEAIQRTATMASNPEAQNLANQHGFNIVNLMWEDTGRYKGSSVGPNISDLTIQVAYQETQKGPLKVELMPVIRYPNFSDKTVDIDPKDFTLLVGNQDGKPLKRVSLYEFLSEPTKFLTHPKSWRGEKQTLLDPRDKKVLVSAQACFLPVPKKGKATFNPVLFNYQSVSGDPAVLTILVTREGTSVTVIDNKRDGFSFGDTWGQRLFHNHKGERTSLTGERFSDYQFKKGEKIPSSSKDALGMSMVLIIQVPLKQKNPMKFYNAPGVSIFGKMKSSSKGMLSLSKSDVEVAVIGHGEMEGPFTEIDNLAIQRDPNYPVRVTVQFYKATSNGMVSKADMNQIQKEIQTIYESGENAGSLVTGGETGRPTEYFGSKVQPLDWWNEFWKRHEENMGEPREKAMKRLAKLLHENWQQVPVTELYLRNLLKGDIKK